MRFYVYALIDPRTGEPFYIGKGQGRRYSQHEKDARKGVAGPKCDRIREIIAAGLKVQHRILERFNNDKDAYKAEAAEVERIGLENLTNIIPGGIGPTCTRPSFIWTEEDFRKIRPSLRGLFLRLGEGAWRVMVGDCDVTDIIISFLNRLAKDLGGSERFYALLNARG